MTKYGIDNSAGMAYVSSDSRYLFSGCKGNIWWVSATIIDDTKLKGM